MHDSVYDIASDPRIAKFLRASLTVLADGSDPLLKELAEGVLAGHVDLREAALSPVYDEALDTAFTGFREHYEQLDDDEKQQLTAAVEQQLDNLLDEQQ